MTKFKNAQVIMLPTQEKSNIYYNNNDKLLQICNELKTNTALKQNNYLYIVNDDVIQVGDYMLDTIQSYLENCLEIATKESLYLLNTPIQGWKKIITTTNKSLNLPQPSDSFIQKYIDSYNTNDVITDILVEYDIEVLNEDWNKKPVLVTNKYDLKINDKFNTITIKEIKQYHGNTLEYWKENAEEDYIKVPISVLKYITVLEKALTDKL